MRTIDEIRADASEHAKQLEAVRYLTVKDLVARWGVAARTVLLIDRAKLPYLALGKSKMRRYDPRDVEAFEAHERTGEEARSA